jgi:[lysine-biosynthesis-protein LysW]--L-2-aminoadipate ligase
MLIGPSRGRDLVADTLESVTRVLLVGSPTPTNDALIDAFRQLGCEAGMIPGEAPRPTFARSGDVHLGRVGVRPTLDGIEPGLELLRSLETAGACVLNHAGALNACHDKLATARELRRAGIPHPRTTLVSGDVRRDELGVEPPLIVKPRFGGWGREIFLCPDFEQLDSTLRRVADRRWFQAEGALVQELVPTGGQDIRIIVAGGEVVGAIRRVGVSGEWKTSSLVGGLHRVKPSRETSTLAVKAAAALGADLVGVDISALWRGATVLDVNGCMGFSHEYSLRFDVFQRAAGALLATADGPRPLDVVSDL